VENGQLVTKSENLRLQGSAGPKSGGDQSKKGEEKRVHRGEDYDLTGIVNLAFSARTEFSVATPGIIKCQASRPLSAQTPGRHGYTRQPKAVNHGLLSQSLKSAAREQN
jgi:hypothetical protein